MQVSGFSGEFLSLRLTAYLGIGVRGVYCYLDLRGEAWAFEVLVK